jgi:hypothetical protein
MEEEKSYNYQRKLEELEDESQQKEKFVKFAQKVI